MIEKLFNKQTQETEEHWVSISDVMAGLMVIFLFIAISYMVNANNENQKLVMLKQKIEKFLDAYRDLQVDLSEDLRAEFEGNLAKKKQFQTEWRGNLDMETLSIRFGRPFMQGNAAVPDVFKNVLRDFFPRYIAILTKSEYKDKIAEIRIEGHTSSEWHHEVTPDEAYFNNMELSQNRSRNVLRYTLGIENSKITQNKRWIKKNLTANGLSSSQPILDSVGDLLIENKEESRRVEFRVVTKSEKLIDEIKELIEEFAEGGEVN